ITATLSAGTGTGTAAAVQPAITVVASRSFKMMGSKRYLAARPCARRSSSHESRAAQTNSCRDFCTDFGHVANPQRTYRKEPWGIHAGQHTRMTPAYTSCRVAHDAFHRRTHAAPQDGPRLRPAGAQSECRVLGT